MAYIEDTNLIEEIESLGVSVGGKNIFPDEAKQSVLRVIREQPTINQWISVKERLPEEDTTVLVYRPHQDTRYQYTVCTYKDDYWGWIGQYDCEDNLEAEITHWMPLPEPPKEG